MEEKMASPVAHSVPDSITTALVRSIKIVPSSAVPSIVDCVLATTGLSPSSLFDSLIKAFPDFLKGHMQETSSLVVSSSEQVTSFTMSLLYLLQKLEFECTALRSFVCTAYIPVLKIINPSDSTLVCQVVELLFGNVDAADIWEVMMSTLVPCCLNSLNTHPSVKSQNKVTFTSSDHSILMESKSQNCLVPNHNAMQILSCNLPIRTACYQLSLLLTSASNGYQMAGRCVGVKGANEDNPCGVIFKQLHCILSNVTVMMLSQDSDMRTSAIRVLLPTIFRAYDSCTSIQFSLHGGEHINSRGDFSREIWKCCKLLLLARHQERYDGYLLLSCNFHSFIPSDDCEAFNSNSHNEEKFDIRADNIFWEEMRNGLVDKEAPVRKQALYILKLAVSTYSDCLREFDTCNPNSVSKIKNPPVEISSNGNAGNLLMTKREKWAAKEAHSLGVELANNSAEPCYTGQQRWAAFLLLYEMLEEYGTHLVEAAWNHQIDLLLSSFGPSQGCKNSVTHSTYQVQMETSRGFFSWLAVLWERGLFHGNPQVRCLIMQSFVNIKWEKHGDYARSVPKDFVLGPLMEGLNDPVHHKDFGLKDVYCSETIKGVANFFSSLSSYLSWERGNFLCGFVTIVKKESFSRAGLMALATCIASFARGCGSHNSEAGTFKRISCDDGLESVHGVAVGKKLLYILQLIIEKSKHHFNPNYRLKVCDWALIAASTLVVATEVPIDLLLNFIWCFPREFTDIDGPLRKSVCDWFHQSSLASSCIETSLLKKLYDFPENFIMDNSSHTFDTFDDDDLSIWKLGAQRWARMLFLTLSKESQLEHIFSFIRKHGLMINQQHPCITWSFTKFLLLSIGLIEEYKVYKLKISELSAKTKSVKATGNNHASSDVDLDPFSTLCDKFPEPFLHILEELVLLARSASAIFWSSNVVHSGSLPGSVTGKLGGPSQRRLTTFSATMLLQAIVSVKAVTSVLTLCGGSEYILVASAIEFLWNYTWKVVTLPPPVTEAGAEVYLAAYEALADVLAASLATFSFAAVHSKLMDRKASIREIFKKKGLEYFLNRFLDCINELVAVRALARSRRAILIHWKWHCLHLILCIPSCILHNGVQLEDTFPYISHATLQRVFVDAVDSLENASEDSFLPMLRSIKSVLELRYSIKTIVCDLSQAESEIEVLWKLVKSAWTSHANCNKRRIAPIASLLSSILHPFVFSDVRMHETVDCNPGPLKWFVEKIVSEGAKSPRTIRLAALHLTGLWFLFPMTINYYMKELKLLTFYGSVAFDEDFEASITENDDARREYLLLARSPDPELVKAFTNTEMYARVSVAVLFHKLFELAGESEGENKDAILHCGKTFLLLLLESVVNDKDLAKELYKKYSRVHRHKIRAWQMICVLSQFVDTDVLQQVISSLNICLYRNNLPAVRQYLETFAINIYLKFPSMIEEQLVPIFLDSNIRPQALSSYVFIAANVILHSTEGHAQLRCLNELLPPIVPFLTSHHHSLRGFTQILVYHVLNRLLPAYDAKTLIGTSLEAKCFETLKAYLHENADCRRLRTSLQGFLDAFDPSLAATPKGIFSSIDEDIEFECVPTALMDQVTDFLNDAREDLRVSIANDERILRNEGIAVMQSNGFAASSGYPKSLSLNFQKKLTIDKILGDPNSLSDVEEEDQLMYTMALLGRKPELFKEGRQELILVASLLDRIPNLAGLARTCEVFRASALAVADKSIAQDKQFQLISVTAEKWVPIIEVPVFSIKVFLDKKRREGFSLVGLEQTANSVPLDQYSFPRRTVLVLGHEKEGIPVDIIHILDACVEIPQLGVVRSLNVHVSGAIAIWEYTRQQRVK